MAHHAHIGQEIPDVAPLDGSRNDEQRRSLGVDLVVGPKPPAGLLGQDAEGRLDRAEARRIEREPSLPAGLIDQREHDPSSDDGALMVVE